MKWLSCFFLFLAGASVAFQPAVAADNGERVKIESIGHSVLAEGKENITFKLSGPRVPKAFTIDGDSPRLVLDFPQSSYSGKSEIDLPGSRLASRIRIGIHQQPEQKIRVVVDLAKERKVKHTVGEYNAADGTLTVELSAGTGEKQRKEKEKAAEQKQGREKEARQEELAARPLEEKPVPPVLHPKQAKQEPARKEQKKEEAGRQTVKEEQPRLLDITFDESSQKGEMVLFRLNEFYPPTVSAVEQDTPRVFCDFMETELGPKVQKEIDAHGKFVQRIRTTSHERPKRCRLCSSFLPTGIMICNRFFSRTTTSSS